MPALLRLAILVLSFLLLSPKVDAKTDNEELKQKIAAEYAKQAELKRAIVERETHTAAKQGVIEARQWINAHHQAVIDTLKTYLAAKTQFEQMNALFAEGSALVQRFPSDAKAKTDVESWVLEATQFRAKLTIVRNQIAALQTTIAVGSENIASLTTRLSADYCMANPPSDFPHFKKQAFTAGCLHEIRRFKNNDPKTQQEIAGLRSTLESTQKNIAGFASTADAADKTISAGLTQFPLVLAKAIYRETADLYLERYRNVDFVLDIEDSLVKLENGFNEALILRDDPFQALSYLRKVAVLIAVIRSEIIPTVADTTSQSDLKKIVAKHTKKMQDMNNQLRSFDLFDMAAKKVAAASNPTNGKKTTELLTLIDLARKLDAPQAQIVLEVVFGALQ